MALMLIRQMPMAAAARHLEEHDTRLWRMLHAHVAAAYPKADFSSVTCVGCDEMSVRKGQRYISVFCELVGKRVLFACEGKDNTTWQKFVQALGEHNGHPRAITHVSIDMSPAYIKAVQENIGSQALVVFDKFHVIAQVNEAVDEARRNEQPISNKPERQLLKKSRWILLKNPCNLNEEQQQRRQGLLKSNLGTLKACQMRLALQRIHEIEDKQQAGKKLRAWCRWVRWSAGKYATLILSEMVKCAQMVERHLEGILGHWEGRLTNAFMEGLNSVFSAVKRKARGYRTITNLIAMLYFHSANLDFPSLHSK